MAGALLVLPALAATGLLDAATSLYGSARAAYYGVRSLVLCIVFAALLGAPRTEGLTRLDPVDVGRLIGLDRVPEVKTLRRRMEELAGLGRADRLLDALARQHLARGAPRCRDSSTSTGTSAPTTASVRSKRPMSHGPA